MERRCAGRLVRGEVKVSCQLLRCIIQREPEQLAYKINHIAVFSAGEAIIVVVCHIQAGMPVVMKRAERHAVVVDLHAVPLRRLPAAYAIFDVLKTIHALSSVK